MGWRTRRWSSGRWWSVSVTLLAAAVRLPDLGTRSLWFDEAFTVLVTRLPLRESLSALLTLGAYSPFYYLVLRPVVAVLGQSEFAYRFSAAVFGILTVPLLYRVGRCWLGRRAGLLAALALSVCPFHLLYSQDGRMYAMMGFFSLAAMDRFVSVLRGSKWWPFILCSALAYLSHYAAIFLIYVQLVCLLPLLRRPRLFRRWFAAQILALLPLAPWFVLYIRATWQTRALGIGWIPRPDGLAVLRTLWNFSSGDTDAWPAGVVVLAAMHGLILVRGGLSAGRVRGILAWWLFLPLLVNFIVSLRQPLYVDRYFMGSLPAYILLLVAGVVGWRSRWSRVVAALAVVGTMVWGTVRIVGHDPYFAKEDWRGVTQTIDAEWQSDDVVILQDYETLIGAEAYRTQEWQSVVLEPEEVSTTLEEMAVRHRRVWLVWRSPRESNHRLCKSEPFDIFNEATAPVRSWLVAHRDRIALDLRLPGMSVVRIDREE
jgi:mannosyltransferase